MSGLPFRPPTEHEIDVAIRLLLWLHENRIDGALRDEISHVRNELWEMIA